MSDIGSGDVHVDRRLTQISIAHLQDANNFVAGKVFKGIPVPKQSDSFYVYPSGAWNRNEVKPRAPGTESAAAGYSLDSDDYKCHVYALHRDLFYQVLHNTDKPINLQREAVQFLDNQMLMQREVDWANNFLTPGKWSRTLVGTADFVKFDDAASNPIKLVKREGTIQQLTSGQRPNTLVISRLVVDALEENHDLLDRVMNGSRSNSSAAELSVADLRSLFKVKNVYIMEAVENVEPENIDPNSKVNKFIGGLNMLLCYVAPVPGLMTPTAGYTFNWSGFMGSAASGWRIKKMEMPLVEAQRIESQAAYVHKLIAQDMGTLFTDCVEPIAL